MGLAPPNVILSGFASDGFFMAMSFLGLGTVLLSSGLSYRVLLLLLKRLPDTQFWHNLGLLASGIMLTPMIPSANGRVTLAGPFAADMVDILGLKPGGAAATRLAVSAFIGATLMSAVFLSSKSVNFVILGLLPPQLQYQMQWIGWLHAGAVTGLAMFVLYLAAAALILGNNDKSRLSKDTISAQLSLLGKVSSDEWGVVVAIFIFVAGIVTVSLHKIQPSWLGLTILCGLLLLGSLSKKEFREKIDWPFLMYLAEMVGVINVFNYLGLDKWVSGNLTGLGIDQYLIGDFSLFIVLMCVIVFVLRLAVPISAAIVILVTLFMPLAEIKGINPWVVGFIILVLGEMWFFPYQCSYYLQLQEQNRNRGLYDEKTFLKFNLLMNVVKVAALFASIPYWKFLGFL
jgi:di/tricarboxylate transporter